MLSAPESIASDQDVSLFDCGKSVLNEWLRTRGLANQLQGFSATVVVCDEKRVVGFYALAPTAVTRESLPRALRGGQAPDPVPALLLGQLAVDKTWANRGLAAALLAHAFRRCLSAALLIGGRAVVVRAIDADAAAFWRRNGFRPSRHDEMLLFRGLNDIAASL